MTFVVAAVVFWTCAFVLVVVVRDDPRIVVRLVWFALILSAVVAAYLHARSTV